MTDEYTFEDLVSKDVTEDEDILTTIDNFLARFESIAERVERMKINPIIKKFIGSRLAKFGIQFPVEGEYKVLEEKNPEEVISTICKALDMVITMKGDIPVSELKSEIMKNEDLIKKFLENAGESEK